MFKMLPLAAAALAIGASALAPMSAADAQYYGGSRYDRAYGNAYQDGYNRDEYQRRGYDGRRNYNRRSNRGCSGTTGTIVGAIAGGLLGRSVDQRGDRALGTVLGAGAGALAGNAIDKSDCRR